jgi:hypothetical protein
MPPTAVIIVLLTITPERTREVAFRRRFKVSHAVLILTLRNFLFKAARWLLLFLNRLNDSALSYSSSVCLCAPHTSRPRLTFLCPPLRGGEKPLEGELAPRPGAAPAARPGPGTGSGRERECGGGDKGAARGADEGRRRREERRYCKYNTLAVRTLCLYYTSLI